MMPVWLIAASAAIVWIVLCILGCLLERHQKRNEPPKEKPVPEGARWTFYEKMSQWNEWNDEVRALGDDIEATHQELCDLHGESGRDCALRIDILRNVLASLETDLKSLKAREPRKPVLDEEIRAYYAEIAAEEADDASPHCRAPQSYDLHAILNPPASLAGGTTNDRRQLVDDIGEGIWTGIAQVVKAAFIALGCGLVGLVYVVLTGDRFSTLLVWSFIASNVASFVMMAIDKAQAKAEQRRIRETTLHSVEALGGFGGSFVAQQVFRHKISKAKYQAAYWTIVALHVAFWTWWFTVGIEWLQRLDATSRTR